MEGTGNWVLKARTGELPKYATDACPYSKLASFLERNGASVRGIVFNVSGAHLMTDLKGNSENHHLFEWTTGFLINFERVTFTINYLRTIAPLAKVVWLGPFVEARVNFSRPALHRQGRVQDEPRVAPPFQGAGC